MRPVIPCLGKIREISRTEAAAGEKVNLEGCVTSKPGSVHVPQPDLDLSMLVNHLPEQLNIGSLCI